MSTPQENHREYITLREYVERWHADHLRMHDRDASVNEIRAKEHQAAHDREHAMNDLAIQKSEERYEARFEGTNEWRKQSLDQTNTYARADFVNTQFAALVDKVEKMEKSLTSQIQQTAGENGRRIGLLERFASNIEGRLWAVGAGIGMLSIGASVLLHFWR